MKTLFLLRHAKSSWSEPGLADFDRPLNERGRRAAPLIARHLAVWRPVARPHPVLGRPAHPRDPGPDAARTGSRRRRAHRERPLRGGRGNPAETPRTGRKPLLIASFLLPTTRGSKNSPPGFAAADPSRCDGAWTKNSRPPPLLRSRSTRRAGPRCAKGRRFSPTSSCRKSSSRSAGNHARRGAASRPRRVLYRSGMPLGKVIFSGENGREIERIPRDIRNWF